MKARTKISLNALRTFEAVARHKSMTRAAIELGVTPGAISRQISELQAILSFDLFDGTRKKQIVTQSGHRLAVTLTQCLDEIDAALLTLDENRNRILDVACLSTFAVRWLIPRLYRFELEHPDIDLRLSTGPRRPNRSDYRVDVSVLALRQEELQIAQDTILFQERLGAVAMPSQLDSIAVSEMEDLHTLTRLVSKTRPDAWDVWLSNFEAQSLPAGKISVFEHFSLAIEAAANGLGVCVAPEHLVADDIRRGRLTAPFGFREGEYFYITREHGRRKRKVQDFVAWLNREVEFD